MTGVQTCALPISKDEIARKVNKPVDKTEWGMTPQTINAYYNPTTNEICFPAAILQPPFFDPTADDAMNYGGIGGVIGHEMSHGFDDQGSQFDKTGNQNNWWTAADKKNFESRTKILVDHFNKIAGVSSFFPYKTRPESPSNNTAYFACSCKSSSAAETRIRDGRSAVMEYVRVVRKSTRQSHFFIVR